MTLILSGTDGLSDIDGSAATPAIRGTDANTGVFFPAADTVAVATGGTERVRVDSSGNVGIGTSPSTKLDVSGPSGNTSFTGTNAMAITVRGSTSSTDYSAIDFRSSAANSGSTAIGRIGVVAGGAGSSMSFGTSNSYASGITNTAMTIDSSGNLLVGTTSARSGKFLTDIGATATTAIESYTANTGAVGWRSTSGLTTGTALHAYFTYNGSGVGSISSNNTTTSFNTSSDYRLKEDIAPMTGALAKVAALKPVTYKWKADGSDGQGFIAHELAEVVPDCVTGEKDATRMEQYEISPAVPATYDEEGNELTPAVEAVMGEREVPAYQGIDTSFLVATLTAAIQEQQALIQSLTARIEALEGK